VDVRKIRLSDWVAGAEERRRRAAWVRRAFVEPYRRERPRDPEKARLLRERGTPENLIGPEAGGKTIPLDDT
jgi:hypothetical protein